MSNAKPSREKIPPPPADDDDVISAEVSAAPLQKRRDEHLPTAVFDTESLHSDLKDDSKNALRHALTPTFLYIERGPGAGQLFQVNTGKITIGRATTADLRIVHSSISRRHTQIRRTAERFFAKDLGSQNGTFVNERKIETEIEIFAGDVLSIGNATLKLRGPGAQAVSKIPEVDAAALSEIIEKPTKEVVKPPSRSATREASRTTHKTLPTGVFRKSSAMTAPLVVFALALGFGLAAVSGYALLQIGNNLKQRQPWNARRTPSSASATPQVVAPAVLQEIQVEEPVVQGLPAGAGVEKVRTEPSSNQLKEHTRAKSTTLQNEVRSAKSAKSESNSQSGSSKSSNKGTTEKTASDKTNVPPVAPSSAAPEKSKSRVIEDAFGGG